MSLWGISTNASLNSVREMMQHKDTVLGLGDGGAPLRHDLRRPAIRPFMLSHWTRDRKEGRLPVAWLSRHCRGIRRGQSVSNDRGILAPGYKADINIIDYDALRLNAPTVVHDLPAGGRRLDQTAGGYDVMIVSGKVVYRGGSRPEHCRDGWCAARRVSFEE